MLLQPVDHDVRGIYSWRRARYEGGSMTLELGIILLLFATVGFAGAGAAIALARSRALESEHDLGMLGVAMLLLGFAALCAGVLGGRRPSV